MAQATMHHHASYEPVATAVPIVPSIHGHDTARASMLSHPKTEGDPAQHSHFADPYFDGRPEVITSFDYDRTRLLSESQKIKLFCIRIPLLFSAGLILCFNFGPLAYMIFLLLVTPIFLRMDAASRAYVHSMHLGITNTSIIFEEEQRMTWYGSARSTKQTFLFANIGVCLVENEGSSVACFACMDHVQVYRRPYSMGADLIVRGLKDAPAFYAVLMAQGCEKLSRRNNQPLPTPDSTGSELSLDPVGLASSHKEANAELAGVV